MKHRQQFALQLSFQVNEQIAARDQILPRKGGIFNQVMRRKDAHLTNLRPDLVVCAALQKETLKAIRWDLLDNMIRVETLASDIERSLVQVGCENLNLRNAFELRDVFG